MDSKNRKLAEIAYMYYIDGLSQNQIAKKIGISRSMVSTLLSEARDSGIVKIEVRDADLYCFDIQRELENIFGIEKIMVIPNLSSKEDNIYGQLADVCVDYLGQIIENNMVIGISWGRTMYEIAHRIRSDGKKNITISPLVGGVGNEINSYHSNVISELMANNLGANSLGLYAPVFVSSKEVRDVILNDKHIKKVLDTSKNADIAIVGVGAIEYSTMRDIGTLEEEDVIKLKSSGVVGDINTMFFDESGDLADPEFTNRTIAITIEELKRIEKIIAVAGGIKKANAIHAALKGKLMDVLITDEEVAKSILAQYK